MKKIIYLVVLLVLIIDFSFAQSDNYIVLKQQQKSILALNKTLNSNCNIPTNAIAKANILISNYLSNKVKISDIKDSLKSINNLLNESQFELKNIILPINLPEETILLLEKRKSSFIDYVKHSKKFLEIYSKADNDKDIKESKKDIDEIELLRKNDLNTINEIWNKIESQFSIVNYWQIPDSPELEKRFEEYIKINYGEYEGFVALQLLAGKYLKSQNWSKAIEIYNNFKEYFPEKSKNIEQIIQLLNAPVENLKKTNLGTEINTNQDEFNPILTADGNTLYFCSSNRNEGAGGDDIYFSELNDGKWTKSLPVKAINTNRHETPSSVSTDGYSLIVYGNYDEGLGQGDLFISNLTKTGWSFPKSLPKPINSNYWDAFAVSVSNGKAIVFVSDRPDCIGDIILKSKNENNYNSDIYITFKTENGWSRPVNLGPTINTQYAERAPFLHPDGRTLYFSSNGHPGLGNQDVFVSKRLKEDSWTEWSEPINLGKEINSGEDDEGYIISTDGNLAYYATNVQTNTNSDIFSITLPAIAHPESVVTIKGKITDVNGAALESEIKWENLQTHEIIGNLHSNPNTGEYFIVLPLGHNYGYFADKKGYYPSSKNLNLQNETTIQNIIENIQLISEKDDKSIRINNIFFDTDKSELKQESFSELDRLINYLKDIQFTSIEINGYTDNKGKEPHNKTLSQKRASAVLDYLLNKGIERNKISSNGKGSESPVSDNNSENGRTLNRRVEFKIIKN